MKKQTVISGNYITIVFGIIILFGLYLISLYNYLLFHGIAELFSIAVAWGIFIKSISLLTIQPTLFNRVSII